MKANYMIKQERRTLLKRQRGGVYKNVECLIKRHYEKVLCFWILSKVEILER